MIQLVPQMKIWVAVAPQDFRKGIDGLAQCCRAVLEVNPFSGAIFIFRNRRQTSIKLLGYDGQGFWICQKRMSKGRFRYWPAETGERKRSLAVHELVLLLWGGNPAAAHAAPMWRPLEPSTG